jgi:nitrogen fixation/metabolism regulation signal transduction histidine kinase
MTPLAKRATLLFALAATIPVLLATVVWLGLNRMGTSSTAEQAGLAMRSIEALDARRSATVERLCRDDLAMDRLLEERAGELESDLDYDRLFGAAASAGGLDVLWVVDTANAAIVARGHRKRILDDGSVLLGVAQPAAERPVALLLGPSEEQRFVVRGCTIARSGSRLSVVGGHRVSSLRRIDEEHVRVVGSRIEGDVVLAKLDDPDGATQAAAVWRSGIAGGQLPWLLWIACVLALAAGLALLFGGYLSRWLQSSADELAEAATRVGRGDFETTLRDDTRAAFPATATAFARMTRELRDAQVQLRQTERVAAWKDIARSLAHELKNPLSPIRLSIETLRKAHARSHEEFEAVFDESTRTILEEVERLRHIVDEFSEFARLPAPTLRRVDLRDVISQAVTLHGRGTVSLEWSRPDFAVVADVDPDQMMQVLHNVIRNASEAALEAHPESGARVILMLERNGTDVTIHIDDNGPGIPEQHREAIFDPYFTTKKSGTGLGLSISHRILAEHGGQLTATPTPNGTRVTLHLNAPEGA